MNHHDKAVAAGVALAIGGSLQAVGDTVYALDRTFPGDPGFAFANIVAATWHVILLLGFMALARTLGTPLRGVAAVGAFLATAGLGLLITAEIVTQIIGSVPIALIAPSVPITAIGVLLLGTVGLRSETAPRGVCWALLAVGIYGLGILLPTSATGDANYFVIAGWGVCWAVLGFSHLHSMRSRMEEPQGAVSLITP